MFYKKKKNNDTLMKIAKYFDPEYYLENNQDVKDDGADPLLHYTIAGHKEDRAPNRWFTPDFYRKSNPDLKDESNLFFHYVLHGWKEKRLPNPFVDPIFYEEIQTLEAINAYFTKEKIAVLKELKKQKLDEEKKQQDLESTINNIIQKYFDPAYYLEIYQDVKQSGMDPLHHYLHTGGKEENRIPNRWFSPDFYLDEYPDLKTADIHPFLHYLLHGWKEKRLPNPFINHSLYDTATNLEAVDAYFIKKEETAFEKHNNQEKSRQIKENDQNAIIQKYFDPEYYLEIHQDVKQSGMDPLHHYLYEKGKEENRIPNRWFSPDFYLNEYPELKTADMTPFLHYLLHGWKEKRLPNPFINHSLYDTATNLEAVDAYFTKEKINALLDRKENEMGYVSSIYKFAGETYVKGWAITGCDEKAIVQIYLNGTLCATVKADMYQETLKKNGVGDGDYGFTVELPKDLLNTWKNTIEVKSTFTKKNLINSPQAYQEK